MTAPFFVAYLEHSLDLGRTTVVPLVTGDLDLAGSVATLRIGKIGHAATIEWSSDDPPTDGTFIWDISAKAFSIDLPSTVLSTLSPGLYWAQVTVTTAEGNALDPPWLVQIRIADIVRAAS